MVGVEEAIARSEAAVHWGRLLPWVACWGFGGEESGVEPVGRFLVAVRSVPEVVPHNESAVVGEQNAVAGMCSGRGVEGFGSVEIPSGKEVGGLADVSTGNEGEVESDGTMGPIEETVQSVRVVQNVTVVRSATVVLNVLQGRSEKEALI